MEDTNSNPFGSHLHILRPNLFTNADFYSDVGRGDLLLPGGVLMFIAGVSKHRRVPFHGLAVCASNLNSPSHTSDRTIPNILSFLFHLLQLSFYFSTLKHFQTQTIHSIYQLLNRNSTACFDCIFKPSTIPIYPIYRCMRIPTTQHNYQPITINRLFWRTTRG
jgi:hypothetical protein